MEATTSRVYADEENLLARYEKIRLDPIEFLKCVRTKDPSDTKRPIKPFPWEKEYIQYYVRFWQRCNKIAAPKSRRMIMTWTNVALFTWDAMFHIGRHEGMVSKKEEDSDELVQKSAFIVENLDHDRIPKDLIPKFERTYTKLRFPQIDSLIQGFPSGADQLRQYTMSRLLFDEMAFWDDAEESFSAAIPTIQGGGQVVCLSSAAPGFFKRLVFDEFEAGKHHGRT